MLIIKILKEGRPGATVKGEIYCDSESVVKKVNDLRHETKFPYSIKTENFEEYDVISSIRELQQDLTDSVKLEWVDGHVEHPTCLAEHLNGIADSLANKQREALQAN